MMDPTLLNEIRHHLSRFAISNSAPIYFYNTKNPSALKNGTIFFIEINNIFIGITAYHVYEEYTRMTNLNGNGKVNLQIGDEICKLDESILGSSKELDLITFKIEPSLIKRINKTAFPLREIPRTLNIDKNQTVFFAGYPGQERKIIKHLNVEFGIFGALTVVESISLDSIKLVFHDENILDTPDKITSDFKFGGISGAALFIIETSPSGINFFSLAGVISEASDTLKIIACTPIKYILDDGKI